MNVTMSSHGVGSVLDDEQSHRITWRRVVLDDETLFVLAAPPEPGGRIDIAYRHGEQEPIMIFGRLNVLDSMKLHRARVEAHCASEPPSVARLIQGLSAASRILGIADEYSPYNGARS